MFSKVVLALTLGLTAATVARVVVASLAADEPGVTVPLSPWQTLLAGLSIATAVGAVIWTIPLDALIVARAGWVGALGLIALIDLRTRYILDACLLPLALLAVAIALTLGHPSLHEALLGGALGLGASVVVAVIGRALSRQTALWMGDVKLAGLLGLILGAGHVLTALVLGTLIGGMVAFSLLLGRRASPADTLPYGPWLCLGGYLALILPM